MLVGVVGLIGSGKGTVGDYLIETYGYEQLSFAESLKDAVAAVFGWERHLLEGDTKESREFREKVDPWWAERLNMPHLTPRWVLQYWGTEVVRKGFHNDMWIASLERKIDKSKNQVITDVRFRNEIDTIRSNGGIIIHVVRGENPHWFPAAEIVNLNDAGLANEDQATYNMAWAELEGVHASEYSWVGLVGPGFGDVMIKNNSTLEKLYGSVDSVKELVFDKIAKRPARNA